MSPLSTAHCCMLTVTGGFQPYTGLQTVFHTFSETGFLDAPDIMPAGSRHNEGWLYNITAVTRLCLRGEGEV